jgi:hypothetical protein
MINYVSKNQVEFTIPIANTGSSVNDIFLSSIQHIFGGVLNKTWNKLYFHCDSKIGSLKEDDDVALSYADALTMVRCLCKQIQFLYDNRFVFVGLDIADIFVSEDRSMFFIANFRNLIPVDHEFMAPFYKPRFISEEIRVISKIPCKMSGGAMKPYYCLGSLVIHLLKFSDDLDVVTNVVMMKADVVINSDVVMKSIRYTKLYWVLEQCLKCNDCFNKIVFL